MSIQDGSNYYFSILGELSEKCSDEVETENLKTNTLEDKSHPQINTDFVMF